MKAVQHSLSRYKRPAGDIGQLSVTPVTGAGLSHPQTRGGDPGGARAEYAGPEDA